VESQVDYGPGPRPCPQIGGGGHRRLATAGMAAAGRASGVGQRRKGAVCCGGSLGTVDVVAGQAAPRDKEKTPVVAGEVPRRAPSEAGAVVEAATGSAAQAFPPLRPEGEAGSAEAVGRGQLELGAPVAPEIQPKGKGQLSSERVQNPHEPDATYGAKGEGERKKEQVGYKIQVAETVSEAVLAPGSPRATS